MLKSFGKLPVGERLSRVKKSAHYREGEFKNLSKTPMLAEGTSYPKMIVDFFSKGVNRVPDGPLPSVKPNLKTLTGNTPVLVWFGHSSYFLRINEKNILVDPVFSASPSPIPILGKKAFPVTNPYDLSDLPNIDLVIITHDHYDHLDYTTINALKSGVPQFYTALGVGAHLESWGVEKEIIVEFDWWEKRTFAPGIDIIATPARHFSGRLFNRNQTLWSSFVLKTKVLSIFIGGDSGYDTAFKMIGDQFGPFDLAILECGQYNEQWPFIHMMPEEVVQASIDLQAKVFMPVHWAKFTLALHAWNDPVERAMKRAEEKSVFMTTPMIGEVLLLEDPLPVNRWWR
jgi:L-ascorbate metabolism protein UlaG (beta-lactamase superfamily)